MIPAITCFKFFGSLKVSKYDEQFQLKYNHISCMYIKAKCERKL